MARGDRYAWLCVGILALRVSADCSVTGLDYTNGGSYLIDASSDQDFAFSSLFQGEILSQLSKPLHGLQYGLTDVCEGCDEDSIDPILIAPTGDEYTCSTIDSGSDAGEQRSTWYVIRN